MRSILILFFLFQLTKIYGQVEFQPGYIINSERQKIQCLIKNVDWLSNPGEIEYRLSDASEVLQTTASDIQGFQVDGFSRYISASVDIDISSSDFNNLSSDRNPVWEHSTVFLKELVEGKHKLFVYVHQDMTRFFYQVDTGKISQLVYKEYNAGNTRFYKTNNMFLQQLLNDVKCDNTERKNLMKLSYKQPDLVKYFSKVNACFGQIVETETKKVGALKAERKKFNLTVTPGVTYSTFSIQNPSFLETIDFGGSFQPRLGAEAEFIFGFNRNKWSAFVEPSLVYYKNEHGISNVKYSAVEFPIGGRHYFYFKRGFSAFINAIVIPGGRIVFDKNVKKESLIFPNVQASTVFAFGAGVANGRFKAEARYHGVMDLLFPYLGPYTEWRRYSLIFGYRFVRN